MDWSLEDLSEIPRPVSEAIDQVTRETLSGSVCFDPEMENAVILSTSSVLASLPSLVSRKQSEPGLTPAHTPRKQPRSRRESRGSRTTGQKKAKRRTPVIDPAVDHCINTADFADIDLAVLGGPE